MLHDLEVQVVEARVYIHVGEIIAICALSASKQIADSTIVSPLLLQWPSCVNRSSGRFRGTAVVWMAAFRKRRVAVDGRLRRLPNVCSGASEIRIHTLVVSCLCHS